MGSPCLRCPLLLLFLIFALLVLSAVSQSSQSLSKCPPRCRCSSDGRHLDCHGAGLKDWPLADELDQRLEHLDLRRNALTRLDLGLLTRLLRLHTLLLGHNQIRHLEENMLDTLPNLHRLHLARNLIRNLPSLSAFPTTNSRLHVLDLHANLIRHVSPRAFHHLNHLAVLNLADNFLQNIPTEILRNVRLSKLDLHGNPWNCDCRIISLAELLAEKPDLERSPVHHQQQEGVPPSGPHIRHSPIIAQCTNPGSLRQRSLRSLDGTELKCLPAKLESDVPRAEKTHLKCDLEALGVAPVFRQSADSIKWLYGGKPVEGSLLGVFELMDDGTLLVGTDKMDSSQFECAVNYPQSRARESRNIGQPSAGIKAVLWPPLPPRPAANSSPAHHHRHQHKVQQQQQAEKAQLQSPGTAPQFTFTPRDRRFREGMAVQMSCEAMGQPRPRITWFFNGQPIEPSRKHELRREGSQLVVYPFLEHDVGVYSCEAENAHGRIKSADARLELIQSSPPVITEGPEKQSAKPGQRVTFRCKSRGEPRPSISWFLNGVEIAAVGGHFQLNEDSSELSIGRVARQDAGTYSCMAGNPVGSMTADAQLEVQSTQLDELDRRLDEQTLRVIVDEAAQNIDRAIAKTKEELRTGGVSTPQDLLRHFKFVGKAQPTELSRAREIYEESLRLVEKHVELGLQLKPTDMPAENISFESVLSVTHIQTLMELSGCMAGQFKDACQDMCFHSKYRSYTGQCNNFEHPTWGVSQMPFLRLLPPIYENGFNTPVGWDPHKLYFGFPKPNARTVSMELIGTEQVTAHPLYSAMLMQWGQFLDHDLDFTATALSRQTYMGGARCNRTCENMDPCFNIPLPPNDPRRRALGSDKLPCIEFERSAAICGSGETSPIFKQITYREQANIITSFLDGSQIYGSTEVDAIDLRDLFGDHGLLRFDIVSAAQKPYLPFERDSAMDCRRNYSQENPIRCFLSGDFRANEQVGLTAMHTVWLREHNRIATKLLEMNPDWDGERIFQETRKIIGGMIQHITYKEWLPKVLGQDAFHSLIGPYTGYDPDVNPSISNSFATAAFRFGHTLINPRLERLDKNFLPIPEGALPLHEAFFAPERLLAEGGVDPLLRGLFASPLKKPMSEQLLNMELTEKLFHRAHNVSLDLAAMNIQRGRDHGIPSYLEFRRFCNLTVPSGWDELSLDIPNPDVLGRLRKLYGHPGNIDLWVGGIVEKRLPDALVGPTFSCIIGDQFKRLRAGDRFWYENPGVFSPLQLAQIKKSTLAAVICGNGDDIDRIQPDVFLFVANNKFAYKQCQELSEKVNLRMWMSCCDESCSARGAEKNEEEKQRRRRRAQQIYGGE